MTTADARLQLLARLYGPDAAPAIEARALARLSGEQPGNLGPWTERDAWLIAYPDQFRSPGGAPLAVLGDVLERYLAPEVTGVHVLPFHPSSSDRGFSVIDYAAVETSFGTWDEIVGLSARYRLMADAVVNHTSAQGVWFQGYLAGDPRYAGFFRTADPAADLSAVVRPRTSPLLTAFEAGPDASTVHVWTTFSADQVDLDYRNPDVLLAVLDVLLRYRARGAAAIRLDAIAFAWKVEGTTSINLAGTHDLIAILRSWLDEVDPALILVTETNVPHAENVAYLGGEGRREAQAVYQFALPPLLLHTLATGDPTALVDWARALDELPAGCTFLNFTSSHDGVGLRPVEGLLSAAQVAALGELCARADGVVNMRRASDGTDAPYELASTWFALMTAIGRDRALERHLLAQAFVLALAGIPLLYTHVLLASDNDQEGYAASGVGRDLNRADLAVAELDRMLADPTSTPARSLAALRRMLRWRASCEAFHPDARQQVSHVGRVVIVDRLAASGVAARVLLNVADEDVVIALDDHVQRRWRTLDRHGDVPDGSTVRVPALSSVWLVSEG